MIHGLDVWHKSKSIKRCLDKVCVMYCCMLMLLYVNMLMIYSLFENLVGQTKSYEKRQGFGTTYCQAFLALFKCV